MQLTVTVLDVNDVTPMFEPQFYLKSVMEDIGELEPAEDRKILTVSAKDDDEGDNAKIVYTITKGNDEGLFSNIMKIDGNVCSPSIKIHSHFTEKHLEHSWKYDIHVFIIWLAPKTGKMNQILRFDWLPERARWCCVPQVNFFHKTR